MKLNNLKHLNIMRKRYFKFPIKKLDIIKPEWLMELVNNLNEIYDDPENLLKKCNINYGCIIQANTLLFDKKDKHDCPATFVTSDSEYINNNPEILKSIASDIYQYKNTELGFVPDVLKEIVKCIQDEYDYNGYKIEINLEDGSVANLYFYTIMVFRKYLPKGYLDKRIYPLITNCNKSHTAMILPSKYWTMKIKKYK